MPQKHPAQKLYLPAVPPVPTVCLLRVQEYNVLAKRLPTQLAKSLWVSSTSTCGGCQGLGAQNAKSQESQRFQIAAKPLAI